MYLWLGILQILERLNAVARHIMALRNMLDGSRKEESSDCLSTIHSTYTTVMIHPMVSPLLQPTQHRYAYHDIKNSTELVPFDNRFLSMVEQYVIHINGCGYDLIAGIE